MITQEIIDTILHSSELPKLLEELNRKWAEEQERRHAFWKDIDRVYIRTGNHV
jgi:hypothetical protein